ncbi:MAG: hypothetical protein B0D92_03675 [Spirochaeta sp. LUC14_002_19_P3]|nr:MAG: hypothetical protein B0D92_03675 [Spirochaeta sp. LUC14_002_19_P3]
MKVLLVGYSNIASRRILPALDSLGLECIEIATRRPEAVQSGSLKTPCKVYAGYEEGIHASSAELCWISTVNSAHCTHAKLALENGRHTIVDKPIGMHSLEVYELADISRKKRLLLSEAVVYTDHLRLRDTVIRLQKQGCTPRHITAVFCFPPLSADNFRRDPVLGGGALMDLGAYIVSPGRFFFGSEPVSISAWTTERQDGMTAGMRVLLLYSEGRSFSGYFSFEGEYQNEMRIAGTNFYVHLDRCFTTPPAAETTAVFKCGNTEAQWTFPADDAFVSYLKRVTALKGSEEMEAERQTLTEDQKALTLLKSALDREN